MPNIGLMFFRYFIMTLGVCKRVRRYSTRQILFLFSIDPRRAMLAFTTIYANSRPKRRQHADHGHSIP